MDAGGSTEAASRVGREWIEAEAREARQFVALHRLMIETQQVVCSGWVTVLYLDQRPIAVATIFRDPMNFAVLVRWKT
jgi:hypothetical protein